MFKTLIDAFKDKEIRKKIFITLGLLFLFRLGSWIPVPGIAVNTIRDSISTNNTFLNLLSAITGGALQNGALLALGVSPYISASIIVQLLSIAIPALERLSKQGEEGKRKLTKVTKWCALILAVAQAIGIVISFANNNGLQPKIFGDQLWVTEMFVVICLTAGAMFCFWLGEKITELGVANGLSLLIFVGILSTAGTSIFNFIVNDCVADPTKLWYLLLFVVVLILIFACIVTMDSAERRVKIQYAKQNRGRRQTMAQSTFIPIKLMGTGVMPIIFAMSFITFPQIIMSIFGASYEEGTFSYWWAKNMGTGATGSSVSWVYIVVSTLLIVFFAYFYAQLSFNPEDISKQIQANGGSINGIRPGPSTANFLKKISNRITFFGAMFLAFIAIVPTIIFNLIESSLVSAFSATGMIIIVGVALEIDKQLQNQMMIKNYRGFLK